MSDDSGQLTEDRPISWKNNIQIVDPSDPDADVRYNLTSVSRPLTPDLRRPGGSSEGPAPDPIPNSAVKTLSADGTASQDVGE